MTNNLVGLKLPVSRIKKIVKEDTEIKLVKQPALIMVREIKKDLFSLTTQNQDRKIHRIISGISCQTSSRKYKK